MMELEEKLAQTLNKMIDTQEINQFDKRINEWTLSNVNFHYLIDMDYACLTVYRFRTSIDEEIYFNAKLGIESEKTGINNLPTLEHSLEILAKMRNKPLILSFDITRHPELKSHFKQNGYVFIKNEKNRDLKIYSKCLLPKN